MMPNFWHLPITPILKLQYFPSSMLIFRQKIFPILYPPTWKLDNLYFHNPYLSESRHDFPPNFSGSETILDLVLRPEPQDCEHLLQSVQVDQVQSTGHLFNRHFSISVSVLLQWSPMPIANDWCLVLVLFPDVSPQVLEQILHEDQVVQEQLLKNKSHTGLLTKWIPF